MPIIHKQSAVEILKTFDDGSEEIVISSSVEDRDGDVIEVDGWELENYLANPVVLFAHDYRGVPVGRSLDLRREPSALVARFKWRDPANDFDPVLPIKAAWDQGILRAASVGFKPLEVEPLDGSDAPPDMDWFWGPKRYKRQELLEWSVVPVPANQDALRRAFEAYLKSLGGELHMPPVQTPLSLPNDPARDELRAVAKLAQSLIDLLHVLYGGPS
jgi:phage head maturation protease